MLVALPGWPGRSSSLAHSGVNAAKVVGPALSAPAKVARPTTVTSTGWGTRMVVVSPMARWPSSAAPLSMTASPGAAGARPEANW
jgi:hypothetical protein